MSLAYESTGRGAPVLFLHALGTDRHFWDFVTRELDSTFTCVLVDLPGHGQSAPAGPWTIEEAADLLPTVLADAGLERTHVVGASMGGMVALAFARRHAASVDRVVIADATPRYSQELREAWTERATVARRAGASAMIEQLLPIWFSDSATARAPDAVEYVRSTLKSMDGDAYADACEALRQADLRDELRAVTAPTLVVAGSDDLLLPDAHALADGLPSASFHVLSGARHAAPLELASEFADVAGKFLAAHHDLRGSPSSRSV